MDGTDQFVASLEELQELERHGTREQPISPSLRGLLAEIATTGVNRYPWQHLRPLIAHLLEDVICQYESEEMSAGPLPPLPGGESPEMLLGRFRGLLLQMEGAPWTLQRLAELLLEPRRQYTRLHKLGLALEKLLLVSGVYPVTPHPPPLPRLADLRPVNINLSNTAAAAAGGGGPDQEPAAKRQRAGDSDLAAGLLTATLTVRDAPPAAALGAGGQESAAGQAGAAAASAAAAGGEAGGQLGSHLSSSGGSSAGVFGPGDSSSNGQVIGPQLPPHLQQQLEQAPQQQQQQQQLGPQPGPLDSWQPGGGQLAAGSAAAGSCQQQQAVAAVAAGGGEGVSGAVSMEVDGGQGAHQQ